ncbi:MAG: ABC transporter permease [Nanoarchaeota archaeon]|nr:ABC transporter permease [Nanoarchaeota archaeon]
MMNKENIKYSLKHLKKKKNRSLLTVLSILVGITTIFIFVSFGLGLYNYVNSFVSESSADKVFIQPKGSGIPGIDQTITFTEDDLKKVETSSGVYSAEGAYIKVVQAEKNRAKKYVFLTSYDPDKSLLTEMSNLEMYSGRELSKNDRGKVTLGYNYLLEDKIFPQGLEVNDKIDIDEREFTILGFYESVGNPQDDSNIYLNNEYFRSIYPEKKGYDLIVARVDTSNIGQSVENIEKNLRQSRNLEIGEEDFFVASFEDLLESYTSAMNIIIGFVIMIALISVFVSAINTANTMITSVLERIKEIGVMKSIGARNSEIFKIFLFESTFLGLVAGILGVILGAIITSIAGKIIDGLGWGFLQPHYSVGLFLGCIAFAAITGAISGVIPAINATRINPVDALRYE